MNASHETSILRSVRKKTRRTTSILTLRSVKFEEISHEMLVLMLQHVSSRVSGFPVASPSLWRKLQNLSVFKVSRQEVISFCVAGVALPDIFTCLQTCRTSFCVALASLSETDLLILVASATLCGLPSSFFVAHAAL